MVEASEKIWPLGGYAPGNYTCRCLDCGEQFIGDKRAITCLECAVAAAKSQIAELRDHCNAMEVEHRQAIEEMQSALADKARLSEALREARELLAGPLVGVEWKRACHSFIAKADAALSGSSAGGWREPNSGHVYSAADLARLMEWRDKFIVSKGLWVEFTATLDRLPTAPTGDHHD